MHQIAPLKKILRGAYPNTLAKLMERHANIYIYRKKNDPTTTLIDLGTPGKNFADIKTT